MSAAGIDPTSAGLIATPPLAAAVANGSPLWLIAAAAFAGAVVWTIAQRPRDFADAFTMLAIGSFIGVVGAKIAVKWSGSVEAFKWIGETDPEYLAAAFGLAGNLIFSFIKTRGQKEVEK